MVNGRLSKGVTSFAGEAALGTAAEVGKLDGKMKRIPAKVVRFPHYDPEKARVRA